jgi:hypothetical protein
LSDGGVNECVPVFVKGEPEIDVYAFAVGSYHCAVTGPTNFDSATVMPELTENDGVVVPVVMPGR